MDLYYSLRNICLVLFAIFALISIIYGVRVHILTTIQKYFGIEKRREMAKRREGGYKTGNTTARMRYVQQANARNNTATARSSAMLRSGAMTGSGAMLRSGALPGSGAMRGRQIDVSQVKTEKMQQAMPISPIVPNMESTVALSQGKQDTVVLSPENQDTVVLSQGMQDTVVLAPGNPGTVVLSQGMQDTVVLSPENQDTVVLSQGMQDTVVLSPENQDTVVLSPAERVIIRMQEDIVVVHGDDII